MPATAGRVKTLPAVKLYLRFGKINILFLWKLPHECISMIANTITMKKNIQPLQTETFYHIYNRGIDGGKIFKEDKNYCYFLKLYAKYIPSVAETYAYCLLGNHFHLLIRTKSEADIIANANAGRVINPACVSPACAGKPATYYISHQFSKLFNSYAQAYNKAYSRTGRLFEEPFRRIPVTNEKYYTELFFYIHFNPQKHGICDDYTQYPFSSYSSFLLHKKTQLRKEAVLDWFGSKQQFIHFHAKGKYQPVLNNLDLDV
ncbi:MAG: hypothetical protein IPM95_07880 [Sphingobacteriales bacterium]|nr:hypothetical protein [Sphingobacteriales bacterium]